MATDNGILGEEYSPNISSIIQNSTSEPNFEDYEYDVSESLVHYDWAELVPAVIVYATVLLLGIFGNG